MKKTILFLIGAVSLFLSSLSYAGCVVGGGYIGQDNSSVFRIDVNPDRTFKKFEIDMDGDNVSYTLESEGTWEFVKGCAIKLDQEHGKDIEIKFAGLHLVDGYIYTNSGFFKGGSIYRLNQK